MAVWFAHQTHADPERQHVEVHQEFEDLLQGFEDLLERHRQQKAETGKLLKELDEQIERLEAEGKPHL
jgi:hypothetical protein